MRDDTTKVRRLTKQLSTWTLVGPILARKGQNSWFDLKLDGAATIPRSFRLRGREVPVRQLTLRGPVLDFEKHLGNLVDVSPIGVRNQAVAFTSWCSMARGVAGRWSHTFCWLSHSVSPM